MERGISAPGAPCRGGSAESARVRRTGRALERAIGEGECVGPSERAHHDLRREPTSDAEAILQRTPGAGWVVARNQAELT